MISYTDPCTGALKFSTYVNNNSMQSYVFSAPYGESRISFFYYAWAMDNDPPLQYSIDATVSATGAIYHYEGAVLPRAFSTSSVNSGGLTISLPYMTSFEFSLWESIRYRKKENFSDAYSFFKPPTGYKPQGRFYAYNDRCGTTFWFPHTQPMILEIIEGNEFVSFYEISTGDNLGDSVSILFSNISNLQIVVEEPPQDQVPLTIRATGGTITKSQTAVIEHYPLDSLLVNINPDSLYPGEQSQVFVTPVDNDGNQLSSNHYVYISTDDINSSARLELRYPEETGWPWESGPANIPKRIMTQHSLLGYVYYVADTTPVSDSKKVTFSINDNYYSKRTGKGSVIIKGEEKVCPIISIFPERVKAGDTATIIVKGKKEDGTIVDYPAGTVFNYSLISGAEYGTIVGNSSIAQFVVNEEIAVDETVITISVAVGSGGNAMGKSKQQVANATAPMCEAPIASVVVEVDWCKKFIPCGMQIPPLDLFQNVVEESVESDWINGGRTSILPLNQQTNFLNIEPCCDKSNDCISLKILGISAKVRVLVGAVDGKKIYSVNDILESEKENALIELQAIEKRLKKVVKNLDEFKGDITALNSTQYSYLFQLPSIGRFNFVGAVSVHENTHRDNFYEYIHDVYYETIAKIESDVSCRSTDSFQDMSVDEIKEALKLYDVQSNFAKQMEFIPASKIKATEQNAHTAQLVEIQHLIKALGSR